MEIETQFAESRDLESHADAMLSRRQRAACECNGRRLVHAEREGDLRRHRVEREAPAVHLERRRRLVELIAVERQGRQLAGVPRAKPVAELELETVAGCAQAPPDVEAPQEKRGHLHAGPAASRRIRNNASSVSTAS